MMRCEVAQETTCFQTFEIRLKCAAAEQPNLLAGLQRHGQKLIVDRGLVNTATITGFGDTLYFVVMDKRGQRSDNAYRTWKDEMKNVTLSGDDDDGVYRKLPEVAHVESVVPFTRFSQRRFGWGDAKATREEVVTAIREENSAELLAIMPEAAPLIQRGELQHLPALFDALRSSLPALADCKHQFFTENMYTQKILGPCGACGKTDSDDYNHYKQDGC